MLIKLLEGQWVNTDKIESLAEENQGNTQVFKSTYVYLVGDSNFFITKERADDLAKRINSPEDVLEELEVTRLGQKPLQLGDSDVVRAKKNGQIIRIINGKKFMHAESTPNPIEEGP